MESVASTRDVILTTLRSFANNFPYITIVVSLIVLLFLLCTLVVIYFKLRRNFSVSVNCWFCCKNTKVQYDLYNKWTCPYCMQYNGFNKDGDYNKVIKEQYNPELNGFSNFKDLKKNSCQNLTPSSNGFCKLCNINQQLKIQQLALFMPMNEKNYDEEIEEYRLKLENAYKLCNDCEKIVHATLKKQEYSFLQNQLNNKEQKSYHMKNDINGCDIFRKQEGWTDWQGKIFKGAKIVLMLYSFLLLLSLVLNWDGIGRKYLYSKLPHLSFLEDNDSILRVISNLIKEVYTYRRETSFLLFLTQVIIHVKDGNEKEALCTLLWGLLHISLWSNLPGLQIFICIASLFFTNQKLTLRKIYLSKNTLRKENQLFEADNPSNFSYKFNESEEPPSTLSATTQRDEASYSPPKQHPLDSQMPHNQSISNLPQASGGRSRKKTPNKRQKARNEVDLSSTEAETPANSFSGTNHSSSVFSKSFLASLETRSNEREFSPALDEVYSNLSGLTLGRNQNNPKKPSNFLFQSHAFTDKKSSNSSSIIKPPKFIKNLSNSWTAHDSNESISRSSTPSSGYSSQKLDHHFDYPRPMSPVPMNPFPRRDCFDYLDSSNSNRFYNFPCCPYDFAPFQAQYPAPVGHSAVYTYTRPTSGPFSYSPPRFPSFPYPTCSSPRMSDTSDSENIFQNAAKSFRADQTWFRIQTLSYYVSISLNLLTFAALLYLFSTGMVSVDWAAPTINLFA